MHLRINRFWALFWLLLLWVACSTDPSEISPEVEEQEEVEVIEPAGAEKYLTQNSDIIFDQNEFHRFDINLPFGHLSKIDNNPAAEEYVEGSITFDGETVSPVGIRYKGSVGAFVNCLSGTDWANPSGFKTCTKLSMKIKFNWLDSDDKFYGLKKLQFHSQNLDKSQLHERLGYYLFRKMGVPAPRSVHAKVYINGSFQGVFALTEQIDGRMMRYNFEDGKGNLYKEIWPLNHQGKTRPETDFIKNLKTNEDENPSAQLIRSFAQDVELTQSDLELKSVLLRWMDMDRTLAMAAVDRTIRHDDGPFHWYCTNDVCSNHNYYWYEETAAQKLHLIPWDLDNAFENILSDINPVTPVADGWGETQSDCLPFRYGGLNLAQRSAGCDKIMGGWTLFKSEYEAKLDYLKNTLLEASSINILLDEWTTQISSATEEASSKHGDALTMGEWESALNNLQTSLEYARSN